MLKKILIRFSTYTTILTIVFTFNACQKPPEFSNIPSISLLNITKIYKETDERKGDFVTLNINFKDGDGDLGINDSESLLPPYTVDSIQTEYFYNLLVTMYYKSNNQWKIVNFGSNNGLSGQFTRLQESDLKSPIKGTISYDFVIDNQAQNTLGFKKNDSIKFDIEIRDRALNKSNIITTNPLILTLK